MAQSIQHDPTALILELSAASTPNIHSPIAATGSQLPDAIVSIPLVQNIRQVKPGDHHCACGGVPAGGGGGTGGGEAGCPTGSGRVAFETFFRAARTAAA